MNETNVQARVLLWSAIGWAVLLVALSFALPIVTILTGVDGPQPRISLVAAYGLAGAAPAAAFLAATLAVAALLKFGGGGVSRGRRVIARLIAALVVLAGLATTITLLIGLFALPLCGMLLAASLVSGPRHPAEHQRVVV